MLNENLKAIRKSKGLSQEELAIRLNVVRQTVSKWENGLSVPDSDLLLSISEVLETPVSRLGSPYLGWDYSDPETAVFGAAFHVFEYLFVRLAPVALVGTFAGALLTRQRGC